MASVGVGEAALSTFLNNLLLLTCAAAFVTGDRNRGGSHAHLRRDPDRLAKLALLGPAAVSRSLPAASCARAESRGGRSRVRSPRAAACAAGPGLPRSPRWRARDETAPAA